MQKWKQKETLSRVLYSTFQKNKCCIEIQTSNLTTKWLRSLDIAYDDHASKASNNLITDRVSEASNESMIAPINRSPSIPTTPSTSSRDPAARAEIGGHVHVVGLLDIPHVVGYVAYRE